MRWCCYLRRFISLFGICLRNDHSVPLVLMATEKVLSAFPCRWILSFLILHKNQILMIRWRRLFQSWVLWIRIKGTVWLFFGDSAWSDLLPWRIYLLHIQALKALWKGIKFRNGRWYLDLADSTRWLVTEKHCVHHSRCWIKARKRSHIYWRRLSETVPQSLEVAWLILNHGRLKGVHELILFGAQELIRVLKIFILLRDQGKTVFLFIRGTLTNREEPVI